MHNKRRENYNIRKLDIITGPKLEALNICINAEKDDCLESCSNELSNKEEIRNDLDSYLQGNIKNEKNVDSKEEQNLKQQEDSILSRKSPIKINEKNSRGIYLINVFKRAKGFAGKIKKNLFYKKLQNMSKFQRKIVNDLSDFPVQIKKILLLKVFFKYIFFK